jgi:hypothetical protein
MKLKLILIALIFVVMNQYAFAENGKGFITGRALLPSGKPMKHALVLCYLKQNGPAPLPERYWRVPDAAVPVDSNGKFSVELIEGEYYVGVIGRKSSELVPGPPVEGDILILLKHKSGQPKIFTVADGKTIDTGTQKGSVYRKSGKKNVTLTTIEGMVLSTDGLPVSGVFVFAFNSPARGSRPVFASEKTGKSGKFLLRVDGDGTFYLKVRDTYGGGKPQAGHLKGSFGGEEPAPVSIASGDTLSGINIVVQAINRPDGN